MNKKNMAIVISAALTFTLASCDTASLALMSEALDLALNLMTPSYTSSSNTSENASSLYNSSTAAFQPTTMNIGSHYTESSHSGMQGAKSNGKNQSQQVGSTSDAILFNQDRNTYDKCVTLLINMSGNDSYGYSDQTRKETQRNMREIREKWAKRGYTINKSSWETWLGK